MELQSLYRIYRPQSWDEIVGQEWIVTTLTNQIKNDTLAHAYLFTGPRGIGKTTSARLLAKILNCEKRKKGAVDPCNACASCEDIQAGRSLDVFEIDAASQTSVDNVRENIIAASRVATAGGKKKVFIIDEVHMLSTSAFNALLKTLEEPPRDVFFVMATTEIHKVPETIISRCQRFDFRRVTESDMVKRLAMIVRKERVKVPEKMLAEIARHAEGGMRDAESMLGQLLSFGSKEITWNDAALLLPKGDRVRAKLFCEHLLKGMCADAATTLHDFMETGGDAEVFTRDCIEEVRRALTTAIGGNKSADVIVRSPAVLSGLLQRLVAAAQQIPKVHIPELPLEMLIAEYVNAELGMQNVELNETPKTPIAQGSDAGSVTRDPDGVQRRSSSIHTIPLPSQGGVRGGSEKKEPPKTKAEPQASVDVSEIQRRWNEVHETAKKYNHSLALVFKVATLLDVVGDVMKLGFRHAFYADRLAERAHQETAARVFEDLFGRSFRLECSVITKDAEEPPAPLVTTADPVLNTILETFGGKVL